MNLEEAIVHAKCGDAVLFTGAGFSYRAYNALPAPDNAIPNAREFSKRLARLAGTSTDYDLPVISQYYIKKKGEHSLLLELLNCFSVASVQPYHIDTSDLPWRRVYTTNYDNCFEFSASQKKLGHP